MAKTKISEFSSTPSDNTDIDSINIAEGCAPSGINNAIRELMAQLKDQQTGAAGDSFVVGGGFTSAGAAVFSSNVAVAGTFTSSGAAILSSTLAVTSNATVGGTLSVTGSVITPTVISVTDNTNAALRVTQLGTGNALLVEDSTNPDATPFVINSGGSVGIGAISPSYALQIQRDGTSIAEISRASDNANEPFLYLSKYRGTHASPTIVSSGDILGTVNFWGYDGAALLRGAQINATVDGTPGTNDMPGRLVFSTTADGAASPTERVRIGSAGQIGIAGANYGTAGQALISAGSAAAPAWGLPSSMTLLGTLTTTSGTTQTLSGLNLTDYKTLQVFINNCSNNAGSAVSLRLESIVVIDTAVTNGNSVWGCVSIDLSTGAFGAALGTGLSTTANTSFGSNSRSGKMPVINTDTSLVFSWNAGSFDAGTITVYGVK